MGLGRWYWKHNSFWSDADRRRYRARQAQKRREVGARQRARGKPNCAIGGRRDTGAFGSNRQGWPHSAGGPRYRTSASGLNDVERGDQRANGCRALLARDRRSPAPGSSVTPQPPVAGDPNGDSALDPNCYCCWAREALVGEGLRDQRRRRLHTDRRDWRDRAGFTTGTARPQCGAESLDVATQQLDATDISYQYAELGGASAPVVLSNWLVCSVSPP